MKISKIIFLGVLALTSGQDPPDPDTTQPAEPTEERIKLTVLTGIHSPPLRILYGTSSDEVYPNPHSSDRNISKSIVNAPMER